MSSDTALGQEIRYSFDDARNRIRAYTGLYPNEDLIRDVQCICDRIALQVAPDSCFKEAIRHIEERCSQLAQAASRFAERDPAVIAAARAKAIAAIDRLQDAVFRVRRGSAPDPRLYGLLRQRSR
jgi:hypothetical protein